MAEALYLKDCYMKEFDAKVISVKDSKFVALDKTAFYPNSGGQPHDTGVFVRKSDGQEFKVVYCGKFSGEISHEIEPVEGIELKDGNYCPDCDDRAGETGTMDFWRAAGKPKDGWSICGKNCGCRLKRVDSD